LARAHLALPAVRPVVVGLAALVVLAPAVLAAVPVLAHLVVAPAVPEQLPSRRSSSAATASNMT
jgi:hypothetical protein